MKFVKEGIQEWRGMYLMYGGAFDVSLNAEKGRSSKVEAMKTEV
jgi:hypothetical protein